MSAYLDGFTQLKHDLATTKAGHAAELRELQARCCNPVTIALCATLRKAGLLVRNLTFQQSWVRSRCMPPAAVAVNCALSLVCDAL